MPRGRGFRTLDSFLDLFRVAPFFVRDARRASATTENPNLAAALVAQGLVASVGLLRLAGGRALFVGAAALLCAGLLFTYSRGGLAAATVGLTVLAFARGPGRRGAPIAALGVLAVTALGFATLPGFRRHLVVEQHRDALEARYEPGEAHLSLAPLEARRLSLRVTNTGAVRWAPEDRLRLSCVWYAAGRPSDAGCATPLRTALAPGESVVLSSEVRAPVAPGSYYLVWEMFSELGSFSAHGVPPALVPVQVGDVASGGPQPLPNLVSERTRSELWRLAAAMWRERPLLGFGPDNFRKLHSQFAGWPVADERHAAHNSVLEVAATTGVLGVTALVATWWTVFAALRRTLGRPSAVERQTAAIVLGLLAAQLAQSSVDYLLSFTAHYLLFGLVWGQAWLASAGLLRPALHRDRPAQLQASGRVADAIAADLEREPSVHGRLEGGLGSEARQRRAILERDVLQVSEAALVHGHVSLSGAKW